MRQHSTTQPGASLGMFCTAVALGAGISYLLDPQSGRRRRALIRDQWEHVRHRSGDLFGKARRDARQRTYGLYEQTLSHLRRDAADDHILEQRVRSALGRLTSHPGAIDVTVHDCIADLEGDILAREVDSVLRGVRRVRGIHDVNDRLRAYERAGDIPSLQGEGSIASRRFELLQSNWSPAPRVLVGAAGLAVLIGGMTRGSSTGLLLAAGGAALLGRSIVNRPLSHALGLRADDSDGIAVQKTIHVYVEPDAAYDAWRDLERFPLFMSHVRSVSKLDERRYHWLVDGPAGVPVEWNAEITADVPGELIAWRTTEDSPVHSTGTVHFEPTSIGGTRVHVRMTYRPPANAVGHAVAKVLGRDPKRQIDADLLCFKRYIETGRAANPTAELRH